MRKGGGRMSEGARVGVLWRGDPGAEVGDRMGATLGALRTRGLRAEPVVFAEHVVDEVRARLRVLHAVRGSAVEEMPLGSFVERCGAYFERGGPVIEQPYQERLADGMIRCYLVGDRVAGFGHQYVTALLPPPEGSRESPPA